MKYVQLAQFCHKMRNLLDSGVDISKAVQMLADEESGAFRTALLCVYEDVSYGKPVSEAMQKNSDVFPEMLISALSMAEMVGDLPRAFERMSNYYHNKELHRMKVIRASIYPVFVLGVLVIAFLVVAGVFRFLGSAIMMVVVAAVIGMVAFALGRTIINEKDLAVHIPFVGKMIRREEYADLCDNLAMFYAGGLPLDVALESCAGATGYGVLKDKLNKAAASVRGGNSLSDAFRQQNLPAEIINRIRVGETSGELDKMLEQAAAGYRLG